MMYVCYYCVHLLFAKELNFKVGVLTTANSLDSTDMDDTIMLENGKSLACSCANAIYLTVH
jgi:hypothetical protein